MAKDEEPPWRSFNDSKLLDSWPEGERLRFIRHQARRIPGAIATLPIELLTREVERLSARLERLEGRVALATGEPLSACARCGRYVIAFGVELYDFDAVKTLVPNADGLWQFEPAHPEHECPEFGEEGR
jgi:hypothetical protein